MHQKLGSTRQSILLFMFTVAMVLGSAVTLAEDNLKADVNQAAHSLSRIVIKFTPGVMENEAEVGRGTVEPMTPPVLDFSEAPEIGDAFLSQWTRWRVTSMRRMYPPSQENPEAKALYGLDRTFIVNVLEGTDTAAMAMAFSSLSPQIEYAQVDSIGQIAGEVIPNDPDFALQYALHNTGQTGGLVDADMDAPQAWAIHTGNTKGVTIAIVDSGVTPHDEFVDRMVPGMNTDDPDSNVCDGGLRNGEVCCPGSGLCSGGICQGGSRNGLECCPDGTCDPFTFDHCFPFGHGTHVAGIAGATGNDGMGMAGVTWGAKIMPVRVLDGCVGTETSLANGIVWAADNGANVINISLQFYVGGLITLRDAINYAHDSNVLVVSAAGNNYGGIGIVAGPARFLNSMSVSGTTDEDQFATLMTTGNLWSSNSGEVSLCEGGIRHGIECCPNGGLCRDGICIGGGRDGLECCPNGICVLGDVAYCDGGGNDSGPCDTDLDCPSGNCIRVDGDMIDVSAPGDRIYSTLPRGYGYLSGTSMSTAYVSGLAALIKSYRPGFGANQIREIIKSSADALGLEGWDSSFGYGRINAGAALAAIAACLTDLDCEDGLKCTLDVCDLAANTCANDPIIDCCSSDSNCDDGSECTIDVCDLVTNTCHNEPTLCCCTSDDVCDDGIKCTNDVCDLATSCCTNNPIPECCASDDDCNDGVKCTRDVCDLLSNACMNDPTAGCCSIDADCDDGIKCTADVCNTVMNTCSNDPILGCCASDLDCNDGVKCTTDACNLTTNTCSYDGIAGCCANDGDCDDGNKCTTNVCNLTTNTCSINSIPGCCRSNSECVDALECTEDTCVNNACEHDDSSCRIPTTSEWGLVILSLLLLIVSKVLWRERIAST